MTQLEERVEKAEKKYLAGFMPGTSFGRVVADRAVVIAEGLLPDGSRHLWCCGFGALMRPSVFGYGYTMEEAFDNAMKKVRKMAREARAKA